MHIALVEAGTCLPHLLDADPSNAYPDYDISSFGTAHDFLDTLTDHRFDLAIINPKLPDMNCPEFVEQVQARQPELPIVIISENDSPTSAGENSDGVSGYLIRGREEVDLIPEIVGQFQSGTRLTLKRTAAEDVDSATANTPLAEMMAATLQHEINNPLMSILGNVELLLNDPACKDAALADRLRIIETSARRIQEITQRLANLICPIIRQTPAGPMLQLDTVHGRTPKMLSNKSI
jgi:signal transduction histidine kinase